MTWEDYRKQIEGALKYSGGTHTFEDIMHGVADGSMQAWVNGDTIAITEIIVYPRAKALHVFLAGGNKEKLFDMIDTAWEWGQSIGCTKMTLAGRKGWTKLMGKYGFKTTLTVMEKSA